MEDEGCSGLRTRSKAAPDWTVEESLTLVNEITAIEADCRDTLSSFQKWKITVENCNALGVNRNLNQCRRKWDSLLSDYKKIKQSGSKKASFNSELFKAIERYAKECEGGYDTDPEVPPLAALHSGSKNHQKTKVITPQKHRVEEKAKPTRNVKSESIEDEECSSDRHTDTLLDERKGPTEINREEHKQNMAQNLIENAELIEAIVKEQMDEDSTRINGDQIIICLSNLAVTLDELHKLQTDSIM